MNKYISEVFLSIDNIDENEWLKFILEISKLNGKFRSWKIYLKIDRNVIRYYIETNRKIPTILSCSGNFLIKNIDEFEKNNTYLELPYIVTNKEKSIIDIYDKNETKYEKKLKQVEIKIKPYSKNNYLSSARLLFKNKNDKEIKYKALFFIPHNSLSIDYSKHTRFSYKKDEIRYLQIQKSIDLFKKDEKKDNLVAINTFPYSQEKYYLNIEDYDFDKHSLIIGGSGTGKSKLIATFIKNIYENKNLKDNYKIIVIDPHSSIENDIGGLDETKVIDMKKKNSSIDLWINSNKNASSSTEIILTILTNIFGEEFNSKLERVLRHSIYLLLKKEILNFENLRKLLTQTEYKNKLIREAKEVEDHVKEFFLTDFNEIKTNSYQEAISPIIALIDEMQMLPAFRNEEAESLEKVIENNFLTLFSLNQAELGDKVTKTISGFIMGIIFQLIQRNIYGEHMILIIDEVAVLENPILRNLLSEARKYNLSIILSGQYFGQVSKSLQEAIFSNVMNYYSFRISREDAITLNNHLQMEMAVKNTVYNRIKLLTELPNRDCIIRISKNGTLIPAFRARTINFTPIPRKKNQILNPIEIEKNKINIKLENIGFKIGKAIDIKQIMKSQSTSRRRI